MSLTAERAVEKLVVVCRSVGATNDFIDKIEEGTIEVSDVYRTLRSLTLDRKKMSRIKHLISVIFPRHPRHRVKVDSYRVRRDRILRSDTLKKYVALHVTR